VLLNRKVLAMPTGKDSLNPGGLMEAARAARDPQARTQAAVEGFLSRLADSEKFAGQFDEAVAHEDKDMILKLIAETGTTDDIQVTIEDLDPDRSIEIKVCWGPFNWYCVGLTIPW
jgi:hypothetical protein